MKASRWDEGAEGRSHSEQHLLKGGRHGKASIHQNVDLAMCLSVRSPKRCVLFKSDKVLLTVQCFFIVGLHGGQTKLCFTPVPRLSSRKSDKMLYQLVFSFNI